MKALSPVTSAILGAIGGVVLSAMGSLVVAYFEHRYQNTQWMLSHEEKRIEQKAHLLDDFSAASSAEVAARRQFLVADAASNYFNVVQMRAEKERPIRKRRPRDTRLKLEFDPGLDGLIQKTLDLKQGLGNKVVELQTKLSSIEGQANIFFGSRVRDAVRILRSQMGGDPFIAPQTLDNFKSRFTPESVLSGNDLQEPEGDFIRKVQADGQADTFEKQCGAIISAMSAELLEDMTREPKQWNMAN